MGLVLIHIVPPVLLSFVPGASSGPATEKYHLSSLGEITHNIYLLVNVQINKRTIPAVYGVLALSLVVIRCTLQSLRVNESKKPKKDGIILKKIHLCNQLIIINK